MLKSRLLSERQVLTVARKKIVFIIVEGPSDDEALGVLMERLFDADNVFVHITHGDITSEPGINPAFIINKVSDIVKAYAKSNHLTQSHFKEIIHIVFLLVAWRSASLGVHALILQIMYAPARFAAPPYYTIIEPSSMVALRD